MGCTKQRAIECSHAQVSVRGVTVQENSENLLEDSAGDHSNISFHRWCIHLIFEKLFRGASIKNNLGYCF